MRCSLRVGSRFQDRTTSQVSTRCHGQSGRENVRGGVHVGVGLVPTPHADKLRLRQPRLLSNDSAGRTTLARVGRWNLHEQSAVLTDLVLDLAPKSTPTLRKDRAVQSSFGSDILARVLSRPPCRARQSADVQLLDSDQTVVLGQAGRELVMKVQTEPRLAGAKARNLIKSPLVPTASAAITPRPLATQGLLTTGFTGQSPESLKLTGQQGGAAVNLASRCCHRRLHSKVKSNACCGSLSGHGAFNQAADGDVPSQRISSDCQPSLLSVPDRTVP
jgi:hypothetical protein